MPAAVDERRILDATLAVWRESGFREATTRRVADRAGIGEMTLFRRFGDKAALFRRALETQAEQFTSSGVVFTGDLTEDLTAAVVAYQQLLDRNGLIVLDFLLEAPRNPQLAELAPVAMQAIMALSQIVAWHQAEGRLHPGPPQVVVLQLLAPSIMRYALSKAQPALALAAPPADMVKTFLMGWGTRPSAIQS
jgi:AcrR family transcriptional regulator